MSKKLLLSIIVVLLITNVATMIFWKTDNADESIDEESNIDIKKPVATIAGKEISFKEWMKAVRSNYGKKQLKNMIDHEVVEKLAKEQKITVDEKVIERDIALLTSMHGLTTETEQKELEEKWREDIIYRYQLEALLAEGVSVPEADIRSYYDKYNGQYQFEESLQLSHILVSDMDTANKVYKELEGGSRFDLLAKEYSIDEDTKEQGGYLGFNSVNTEFLPANYIDVAKDLKDYSYSKPFQVDNGVAILYLHTSLPKISFSYDELKPYIEHELALQSKNQNLIADPLWDKLDIKWVYEE
ncbi:peptidylprolyl isomerase [Ornithinibacillus bavariensis]|uniref:peptidylprolyl isomerase n=1 Tax=Ornithinibacillus bavariensis TaxID=545502 RepID=A0A919XB18_9BACI|nr:peptidyl-prolyl cis-trans isomerase [Ornithinibacillus bavariensis]GIO28133.1 foldase protein PrsA [Ornithinibacillus bavariensis]